MDPNVKFVQEELCPVNPLPYSGVEVLFWCHIVTTNKIKIKERKLQPPSTMAVL
jgi:hypothetical protein